MSISGSSVFDPLVAGGVGVWIIVSTLREIVASREELIAPERIECGYQEHVREGRVRS